MMVMIHEWSDKIFTLGFMEIYVTPQNIIQYRKYSHYIT
jgi:hypothetical protein